MHFGERNFVCSLDWFPGYAEYNNYNKQPNDDGLSSQDCVEIRHYFQPPAGVAASHVFKQNASRTLNYMWNDRDCGAENFFLCERPMSESELYLSAIFDKWVILCYFTKL